MGTRAITGPFLRTGVYRKASGRPIVEALLRATPRRPVRSAPVFPKSALTVVLTIALGIGTQIGANFGWSAGLGAGTGAAISSIGALVGALRSSSVRQRAIGFATWVLKGAAWQRTDSETLLEQARSDPADGPALS